MPLAKIEKKPQDKTKTKKIKPLTLVIGGSDVTKHNELIAKRAALDTNIALLAVNLKKSGGSYLHAHNVKDQCASASSVLLTDSKGSTVRVTSQEKYALANETVAEQLFESQLVGKSNLFNEDGDPIAPDVNDYVAEIRKAKFDATAFVTDGVFNAALFGAMNEAISAVAKRFNIDNPLTSELACIIKPDFHDRRYKDFTLEAQELISDQLSNTVTLTPTALNGNAIEKKK